MMSRRTRGMGALAGMLLGLAAGAGAQTCTTQAKMTPELRNALAAVSQSLAAAVKAGDAARVQSMTIAQFANSQDGFAPTAELVHSTGLKVVADSIRVTQIYALDARGRAAGSSAPAEFTCALSGSAAETDFSIPGLPPGMYGFAMAEATGPHPWLLAFLLQQEGGVWKLAGFYPRPRVAAGHDGGWYWKTAYEASKAKQPWLAWLLFDEADRLLRPANFVTSTRLDSLRAEQRTVAPPELVNGVTADAPLVMKAANGTEFRFTGVEADAAENAPRLSLTLHYKAAAADDVAARSQLAAQTFVSAHPELRPEFDAVVVIADVAGRDAVTTERKMAQIP